jgi:hypothetical protein
MPYELVTRHVIVEGVKYLALLWSVKFELYCRNLYFSSNPLEYTSVCWH